MASSILPDTANYDLRLQLKACQSNARRNGKVARLPAALRDQVNRMLDDGLPYKQIIHNLGPAGQHLTEDNLSNWRHGGYDDYLKTQTLQVRAAIQAEAAADLLREPGAPSPELLRQACSQIGLLSYFTTLLEHGDDYAKQALNRNPAKFITLINSCCNLANTNIAIEKDRLKRQLPHPHTAANSTADSPQPAEHSPSIRTQSDPIEP
jgi:hypothetical protein